MKACRAAAAAGGNRLLRPEATADKPDVEEADRGWAAQIKAALMANRFRLVQQPIASLVGDGEGMFDLVVRMPISPASALDRLPGDYVGSGPYAVVEQSATRVVVAAHDEYWGGTPEYREIHWIAEGDAGARADALLDGARAEYLRLGMTRHGEIVAELLERTR